MIPIESTQPELEKGLRRGSLGTDILCREYPGYQHMLHVAPLQITILLYGSDCFRLRFSTTILRDSDSIDHMNVKVSKVTGNNVTC